MNKELISSPEDPEEIFELIDLIGKQNYFNLGLGFGSYFFIKLLINLLENFMP